MHNLMTDPLIRARIDGSDRALSLPELYAAMAADRVESFPALRPHQRHAWHMFLAQLGAIALHRGGLSECPQDGETWTALLRALTPDHGDDPWTLVLEDATRPAFLQPPAPEGSLAVFKNTIATPDALDVLITAKNFDLKRAVAADASPEDWLFALVSLQTMEGFLGAGNYGVARMNGGFSARPFVGLAPEGRPGAHLSWDICAMLAARERLEAEFPFYARERGIALLWLEPWDGKVSISLQQLDPWFIEICRRVRLGGRDDSGLIARSVGTKAPRIAAKDLNGVTGDFWAPVNKAEGKAFSLDARGYSARVLTRLLFGAGGKQEFALPPALEYRRGDNAMRLITRGVTRGQGKTEGFHERIIPFAGPPLRALFSAEGRAGLGVIAVTQLKEIDQIAKALRLGCAVVACGGSEEKPKKEHYGTAGPFLDRLDAVAEAGFFAALQDRFTTGDAAKAPYLRALVKTAKTLLDEASEAIPCASLNRPRARVHADRAFHATLWGPKSVLVNDRNLILEVTDAA